MVLFGNPFESTRPLVRIHSECVFAEVLDSSLCDCADQLTMALQSLAASRAGILFYLRVDGRGAGLAAKVAATRLEVEGMDTWDSRVAIGVAPEGRSFTAAGELLYLRGIRAIALLTNNPEKARDLAAAGIDVDRRALFVEQAAPEVRSLYQTKAMKFGHAIPPDAR